MARLLAAASSQYLSVADNAALSPAAMSFSVWVWFVTNVSGSEYGILSKRTNPGLNSYQLYRDAGNLFTVLYWASVGVVNVGSSAYTGTGAWKHIACTYNSTDGARLYVDGVADGTAAADGTLVDNADTLRFGDDHYANYLDGRIAEVGIWNTVLSASEIAALAARVPPPRIRRGNLNAYWPLYGLGSPEPEYAGSTLNATLVNSPTQADHPPTAPAFGFDLGWMGAFTAAAGGADVRKKIVPAYCAVNA